MTVNRWNYLDEELGRGGLFVGPGILASLIANGIYRVACEGRLTVIDPSTMGTPSALLFLFVSAILAWRVKSSVLRFAFIGLALCQSAIVLLWIRDSEIAGAAAGWILVPWALALVVAGAKSAARHKALTMATVFVGVLLVSYAARSYSDRLMGRDTIFRDSPICLREGPRDEPIT